MLASIASAAAPPTANVVFLDGDLFDQEGPRVIDSRLVPGYVTTVGPYNGLQTTVQRLDPNAQLGFGLLAPFNVQVTLPAPAAQYNVVGNQVTPAKSVAFFGDPGVYDRLRVAIEPPGALYNTPIRVRFHAPILGTTVTYSLNGGPAQAWGGQDLLLTSNTVVTFSGSDGNGAPVQKAATYTFQFPPCLDLDSDRIPDRIETSLGLNPFVAEGDLNGNIIDDFDEYIRGANVIVPNTPNYVAPLMVDTDGDKWSTYDENLRGTDPTNPNSTPVSPSLQTVEIRRTGILQPEAPGGSAVPGTPPQKPFPTSWRIDTITPDATVVDPGQNIEDNNYVLRAAGHQFHLYRARANDGSGRVLLGLQPPVSLCIDTQSFCNLGSDPVAWRNAYRPLYEANVYRPIPNQPVNPRTMAEALLLNRYYEVAAGEQFVIAESGKGPGQDLVLDLRAIRNEAALYQLIQSSVTTAMIDLVTDYVRYHVSPREETMLALLTAHFAGRPVDEDLIPPGVRQQNIGLAANAVANFINLVPNAESILTGTVDIDEFGFLLDVNGVEYRLTKLTETFVAGISLSVRALVDVDNCGFTPIPAEVVGIVSRGLAPLPPIKDTDGNGIDDDWELFHFGEIGIDPNGDADNDGISNEDEFNAGSDPKTPNLPFEYNGDAWILY